MTFRFAKKLCLYACVFAIAVFIFGTSVIIEPNGEHSVRAVVPDEELGKQIYHEGILPSGETLRGMVQGDVELTGEQVACVSCHRRSGLGASEGGRRATSVTAPVLFQPREVGHQRLYSSRTRNPEVRSAYTDATLARAIREGIDPTARSLDPLMPRYALSDKDLGYLTSYLKTLSSTLSPGVTDTKLHFATIVADDVALSKQKAVVEVLETFFRAKNAQTRGESKRAQHGPWHKEWDYQAYRQWILHVWKLKGPIETWRAQLESYYQQQPVFALVSGIVTGEWRPVHEFCEENEVPCFLPNTDFPVDSDTNFYNIYFSEGLALEAKALAKHLHGTKNVRIVQVYREDQYGSVFAEALRKALRSEEITDLESRSITSSEEMTADFWRGLLTEQEPTILVLWLNDNDLGQLNTLGGSFDKLQGIYLSSTLVAEPHRSINKTLWSKVFLTHPYVLPDEWTRRWPRIKSWLKANNLSVTDERITVNTFFAARVLGDALMHIAGNLYRDYFIEKVEHRVTTGMVSKSVYPHVSLGPGQRFLSKGSYIVTLSEDGDRVSAVSDWIVP